MVVECHCTNKKENPTQQLHQKSAQLPRAPRCQEMPTFQLFPQFQISLSVFASRCGLFDRTLLFSKTLASFSVHFGQLNNEMLCSDLFQSPALLLVCCINTRPMSAARLPCSVLKLYDVALMYQKRKVCWDGKSSGLRPRSQEVGSYFLFSLFICLSNHKT